MRILPRPIKRIGCFGEVMIELAHSPSGQIKLGVAGDTYNSAVYLHRLLKHTQTTVSYVTALGTDPYSARIKEAMRQHGLSTDYVERRTDKFPGLYAIDTDADGERSFTYWRSDAAARTLFSPPCTVPLSALAAFDLIYLSGITMAILPPTIRAAVIAFLKGFRADGGVIAYDSNYRPRLWESQKVAQEVNTRMWHLADVALPSLDDEMALFGDSDEAAVLKRMKDFGVSAGALKRGADGPLDLSGRVACAPLPQVTNVVDSTAAGDSFNAGYLAAIVRGEETHSAMAAGHTLAAQVIAHQGAILPE
ncbi:sugar kinase [Cognatishimia sp. SS12]|uniref:sugar kinase n=1 Tax=Cognatishimia sp. SS12 TaxID=2979465 RepID=UPI002330E871|nr:sugar kinase [Cognatishimia sp. SS12]MDC0738843.1 sugar kinase [Cognatishimia sp. SS12]